MKKLAYLNYFAALLILSVAPIVLFSGSAQAYVYDHFASPGINPSLWVDRGPNMGLFSQPGDSYLYFNDSIGGQVDKLRSYNPVSGAFTVLMKFSNFQASNTQMSGQGKSSCVELAVVDKTNSAYVIEGKNISGQFFQAGFSQIGNTTPLKYVYYENVNSGWLGIRYNGVLGSGGKVDFLYNIGGGWEVIDSCAPNFSQAPWFSIVGLNTFGESLSFLVDQVQVIIPNPAPINFLLLEPDS